MKPDQKHQEILEIIQTLESSEIRRRLEISNYKEPEFIPSEVLVSLIRIRYKQRTGLLDAIVSTLYERLLRLIERYFRKNPNWNHVVSSSSESLAEAASYAWEILILDQGQVSFAEVRFLEWVEARAMDYLKSQVSKKVLLVSKSYDALSVTDEDGNKISYENLLAAEDLDSPGPTFERNMLSNNLLNLLLSLESQIRRAVFFRLVCKFEWAEISELLNTSKPTARKYYKKGIEQLKGAIND